MRYRFAHSCRNIADKAAATLKTPLWKNSEFTQTTYFCGVNAGGLVEVGGIDVGELEA